MSRVLSFKFSRYVLADSPSSLLKAIVLGLTAKNTTISGVPSAVYITFITIECCGILVAALLMNPTKVRRDDGRPLAIFTPLPWHRELKALGKACAEPKMLLITLSIFSSEMYLSLCGTFNSVYLNSRSRALANVSRIITSSNSIADLRSSLPIGSCKL